MSCLAHRLTAPILSVVLLVLNVSGQPAAAADLDPEQVRTAIDRGVEFLKRQQGPDGSWPDRPGFPGAVTALCTLALLQSGMPVEDPVIQRALTYLRHPSLKPERTYAVALQTMALAAAEPQKDLPLLRRNVKWLEENQIREGRRGAWSYPGVGGDNSNSQFAMLALHEAERVGVKVGRRVWTTAYDYWIQSQNRDGSWGYFEGQPGTGSMTSAGITSVIIASGQLHRGDAEVLGGHVQCCRPQEDNTAVQRGLQWLANHWSTTSNPPGDKTWLFYYWYALERVGRMTNNRFVGQHDWYREIAQELVSGRYRDRLSGYWKGDSGSESNPVIATSFALLFLTKGRRPVAIAKLKHEPGGDWNRHRSDVHHLLQFVEQQWKMELTWQVVDAAQATADDLAQSPVIFISGRDGLTFTDQQVQQLREFVQRGGYILADATCEGEEFDHAFHQLIDRLFPEPEYELQPLPPDHAVYHAFVPVDPTRFPLWGVNYACRTSVFYSPKNLSCYWELARPRRDEAWPSTVEDDVQTALHVGINVLQYATNRELKYKYEVPARSQEPGKPEAVQRARLYIAKLRHSGGWDVAPAALGNLLRTLNRVANLRVAAGQGDRRDFPPSDDRLFDYHLVFMHGRSRFQLQPQEVEHLRVFLERGGILFADAVCGSAEFGQAFREQMRAIFPDKPLERIPTGDALFSDRFGGYDLRTVQRRDPAGRCPGGLRSIVRKVEPELWGIRMGERWGVIFSPYDLSCALENQGALDCKGYLPEDAQKLGINVVLYSLHE